MSTLWKPMTYGEELFLNLYDELGAHVKVSGPADTQMDFLVDSAAFQSFSRLSATAEVFFRCVRSAESVFGSEPSSPAARFAGEVRRDIDLPPRLLQSGKFSERLKNVGRIVFEKKRDLATVIRSATRGEPEICYMCGIPLTSEGRSKRSVEHIWPISLGGETVEQNLILACEDCNRKRGHMATWAHGPVQSTYYTRSTRNPANASSEVRLSLALARLMFAAAPTRARRHLLTLKEAAQSIRPAFPILDVEPDRPYVYFELLQHIRVSP